MIVFAVGVFFLVMGVVALVRPERVAACFGTSALTRDGRSEVRAVYGGFGVGLAVLLTATAWLPGIRAGVLCSVAVSLAGMAAGRLLSALIDGWPGAFPRLFLGVELMLAAALVAALLPGD